MGLEVNQVVDDQQQPGRANAYEGPRVVGAQDRVEMEIERRLKVALADRGPFARVHPSPKSGSDVPDEDEVALVALGPEFAHDAKAASTKAIGAASEILVD